MEEIKPKGPGGQPTKYSEEMIEKTRVYIDQCEDVVVELPNKTKMKVNIPTIEGLAFELKVNKDTIYEWCSVHQEYSDIIDTLRAKQARELISKGLSGDYNSTIAKVLLTKHGYREGQELSGKDGGPVEVKEITGMRIIKENVE
jgi:hypothetical protein